MGDVAPFILSPFTTLAAPTMALDSGWQAAAPESVKKNWLGDIASHSLSAPRRYTSNPADAAKGDFQHPFKTYDEVSGKADERRSQEAEAAKQGAAQNALLSEAQNRQANEEALGVSTASQAEARRRQRSKAMLALGRRSTILTGPLGLPGSGSTTAAPTYGGKTLLGG
jgi:hypothetical protein